MDDELRLAMKNFEAATEKMVAVMLNEIKQRDKRIAELEMLNREHLKTIARDDVRLAELHDAKDDRGKACNAYASRVLEQDKRIAELEADAETHDATLTRVARLRLELEADNERLRGGHSKIIAECSQENCDGEPWDTFQAISLAALEGGQKDGA